MLLSNAPAKLTLPFANGGNKNTVPVASSPTPGLASYTDGFPPLTMTPIAAGGIPPSGKDFNGVLNAITASIRWWSAGAGYPYDATFAADTNIGGYPKGAMVMCTDGLGYWLNTSDNNTTDPETGGAGWVPEYAYGITAVTLTNANVTLTPLQGGRKILALSGTLAANLNLILPAYAKEWLIVNNCTGAFNVTVKYATGTGVTSAPGTSTTVYGDGTNVYLANIGTAAYLALSGGNMSGGINYSLSTVASAATPDIWTGTGNLINITGTTGITGFAAAPQAGASRRLVMTGALTFTNGANLLVQGGGNYTSSAGDVIDVEALTTTRFRLVVYPVAMIAKYQGNAQEFTASGSFTVPAGVTQIFASGCAAGGGGAASSGSGSSYTGGGGGAGQSVIRKPIAVTPGQVVTITIGAAGAGGAAGANNGVDGGNTVVGSITLTGGGGGKTLASGPGIGGKGGGCNASWVSATAAAGGNGATGPFGQGGVIGGWATGATAFAGGAAIGYGSGGAGAVSCYSGSGAAAAGGSGTQGYVLIEW